ncbi:uncharacterized protein TRIADDRAFT_61087 [Trichoplax adhaerens]|uniref:Major facilitator superfamily (MFS) profile domain-containing protein n=1 Tax=Trichoplax adhaerens TaxID=10228 RepID=B3SA02_TRIAD|nr:hypothetical protein TRIADDRAFT_61087 [Trichoplax adhaerens]EDV20426.1 hypothetical protein TRIADDRAFT_61087 [Trichoplax adhaerens]|eukprot:XP_002117120.1 hypothetical protein TRIADDRAFT_61087 [Trichoplax adhaerens]
MKEIKLQSKFPIKTPESSSNTETFIGYDKRSLEKQHHITSNKIPFIATAIASLSLISFGYMLGYTALAIPQLTTDEAQIELSENSVAWFGSLIMLGAFIGSIIAGRMIDHFGRQCTLITLSIPATIGWFIIVSAQTVTALLAGRILTGISLGMSSVSYSVYMSEISTASMRGLLGGSIQFAISTGYILNASIGMITTWRYSAIAGQAIATILAIGMVFMPESPHWLIANGYRKTAIDTLRRLRGPEANINFELTEIESLKHRQQIKYSELWSPSVRKPFLISLFLLIAQKWTGFHSVLFFCPYILRMAGFQDFRLIILIMAISQFVGSGVGYALAGRFSRVKLLLSCSALMTVSGALLGVYFYLLEAMSLNLLWLSFISTCGYVLGFNISWGGLAYAIMSEILPLRVRGVASGLSASVGFLAAFAASYAFLPLAQAISVQGSLWFYTGLNVLIAIIVFYCVPETKGKKFSDIEKIFDKKKRMDKTTMV